MSADRGFANFVVLGYRITPFAAIDLLMVKDVISMLDVYFSKVQQVLLVVAAVAVIAGIVILFRKSPKFEGKKHVMRTMVVCIVMWIGIMLFTNFNVSHNIISDDFANLGMAYQVMDLLIASRTVLLTMVFQSRMITMKRRCSICGIS